MLQLELTHERERSSVLEERVGHLRKGTPEEGASGSSAGSGQSEAATQLLQQESEIEISRLRADLVVSSSYDMFSVAV